MEDDAVTQLFMTKLLGRHCNVLLASDGAELRKQLEAHPDEIGLVLMDLSLRGSEDGLELTCRLREREKWKDLPIVAVTAHASSQDRVNALASGCDDYLAKPIDPEELLRKTRALLTAGARAEGGAEARAGRAHP